MDSTHFSHFPTTATLRFRSLRIAAFAVLLLGAMPAWTEETFKAGESLTLTVPLDTGSIFNNSYPIDSLGYAELPVLGMVQVGGRTRTEVQETLSKQLAEYLRDSHVQAVPTVRVTFLGHWVRPGMFYANPEKSLWDIVRDAGGPAGELTLDKLAVLRGDQEVPLEILNAFAQGRNFRSAGLKSGDIIVLPVPTAGGFWYWFRESLTVTTQLATVASTLLTAYVTYLLYDSQQD